ncbi:MAG: FAD dependent oxidoreductase [Candidatus Rokubacteria bacterium CSP1-6]|nr:MAG: FAD dependent oxidoreductase [Candidatus Rokubacteria bacterium CSP1-6]
MYDVVIIGGGVVGSSIAYHLTREGRAGRVCVVEPDPTYEFASTPRAVGGVRRLFSLPENIAMSRLSLDAYRDFEQLMAVGGEPAPIGFRRGGYLFLYSPEQAAILERNFRTQRDLGCPVELLDRDGLKRRFPSLGLDDVAVGCHSPEDGWVDPYSALLGFRRKAQSQGAVYLEDRVVGLELSGRKVSAVSLEKGGRLPAAAAVNAAGAWALEICRMVGMRLPVEPLRRMAYYFETRAEVEPLPLTKDLSGLFFKPEGAGFVGGLPNMAEPAGFNFELDYGYFDRVVWPSLARRVPAFAAAKLQRGWAGLYDQNRLDGNAIIGPWTGGLENFHVACGFSGHGLMHAPAVGLAVSELLLDGRFSTIDLSRLGYRRVVDGTPLSEQGII